MRQIKERGEIRIIKLMMFLIGVILISNQAQQINGEAAEQEKITLGAIAKITVATVWIADAKGFLRKKALM